MQRRTFASLTAASYAAAAARGAAAPSNQVRLGILGVANRGGQLLDAFKAHADCAFVVACDVDAAALKKVDEKLPGVPTCKDYREVLARKDLDAVVIATPDHWHALQTIHACAAGKDAYCEKPLSSTIVEGRKMVEAARRTKRVVQVGLHRRSAPIWAKVAEIVQSGALGKVTVARAYRLSNMAPTGIGNEPDAPPPDGLDWNLWLGPRADRPFSAAIHPYKFRWWNGYSSQMGNWGVHYFDAIRWATGDAAPASVVCIGGKYAVDDRRTIPDTAEAVFELPSKALLVFGQYEGSGNPALRAGEVEFRGTEGTLYAHERGYEIVQETGGQFQAKKPRGKAVKESPKVPDPTTLHARNFLDCVASRATPHCDVEEGHRSTVFCHLANLSLQLRQRLDWDPQAEKVTNVPEANQFLHYEYRAPWKL